MLERGARVILIRPAPVPGYRGPRSFALPEFDPFWAAGRGARRSWSPCTPPTAATSATSTSGRAVGGEILPFGRPQAFGASVREQHRDIQDTIASVICHGLFTRFPKLRIALIENGAGWVPTPPRAPRHHVARMPQASRRTRR